MKRNIIDAPQFSRAFSDEFRKETIRYIGQSTKDAYFENPSKYFNVLPCDDLTNLKLVGDLYQPNFYAIDFLLSLKDRESYTIVDYGCGLGVLVHYLNYLGFNSYGYDSWLQLSQHAAEGFLDKVQHMHKKSMKLRHHLISEVATILTTSPDIVCVLGVPRLSGFAIPESVKYLLVDSVCSLHEKTFEEFKIEKYWKSTNTPHARPNYWAALEPANKVRPCPENFERIRSYTQLEVFKRR